MPHQELMGVPALDAKTLVNDVVAKALLRLTNELSRVKRINEMVKTELAKTRLKLKSVKTDLLRSVAKHHVVHRRGGV